LEFLSLSSEETMTLRDKKGHVLARIHTNLNQQITAEELEHRRAYQGDCSTTAEVHDHLHRLFPSNFVQGEEFRVEWLPGALVDLETISTEVCQPAQDRNRAALIKFIRAEVAAIDQKLRAWATLASKCLVEEHVLRATTGCSRSFSMSLGRQSGSSTFGNHHDARSRRKYDTGNETMSIFPNSRERRLDATSIPSYSLIQK